VQHALRAYTPDDAKALKATVSTFPTTKYDLAELLTQLGIGEAVVTVLNERGAPTPVAWTRLRAPESSMDPSTPDVIAQTVASSAIAGKYSEVVDRESAYERLAAKLAPPAAPEAQAPQAETEAPKAEKPARRKASTTEVLGKAVATAVATTAAREILRGLFGNRRR
jgi:hypothetical protein